MMKTEAFSQNISKIFQFKVIVGITELSSIQIPVFSLLAIIPFSDPKT